MSGGFKTGLVSTEWLAQNLEQSNLRIFDCTVFLGFDPAKGVVARGAKPEYEEKHIPGAAFLDLYQDLSVRVNGVEFMMPSAEAFSNALSMAGLGNEHRVVLYSSSNTVYASKF